MNEKPKALRLAQELDAAALKSRGCLEELSAAELRRLHAENERLREALQGIADVDLTGCGLTVAGHIAHGLIGRARAALRREE